MIEVRTRRVWESVAAGIAIVVAAIPAVAQDRGWEWGMHPMPWMWGAWGIGMMLGMLAFWAVIIAGFVIGIRWLAGSGRARGQDVALQILRERYARGEIDREEFTARRRDLQA
jgi:putative membrane protein